MVSENVRCLKRFNSFAKNTNKLKPIWISCWFKLNEKNFDPPLIYAFIDNKDQVKSVFSGVVRNSLSWSDVQELNSGNKITKILPYQFLHSRLNLEITIQSRSVNIRSNCEKELVNNFYKPININDVSHNKLIDSTINFINSTSRWITKIKKFIGESR